MFRRLAALAAVLATALGLAAAPALAAPRDADPALWVVRDADTTIYLFGTVHFLPKDLAWFDDGVADAFNASDELRMELMPVEDPASLAPLILKLAVNLHRHLNLHLARVSLNVARLLAAEPGGKVQHQRQVGALAAEHKPQRMRRVADKSVVLSVSTIA